MKTLLIALLLVSSVSYSQDNIFATFMNAEKIRKVSVNPVTGVAAGSFSDVENISTSAALGATNNGYLVYLQYGNGATGSENGRVDIWVCKADGTGSPVKVYNNFDLNGNSNDELGFVRLGITSNNVAWIVSKETSGNTIHMAKFNVNGTNAVTPVRAGTANTSDNTNSVFENGDIAFDGLGAMYLLANNGNGSTKIYTVSSSALASTSTNSVTSIVYKWSLKKSDNSNFSGRVNGCAFASKGSMYLSTDDGLYFIDHLTTNFAGTGTVLCTSKMSQSDMTDLATAYWPMDTYLPIKFEWFNVKALGKGQYEISFSAVEAEDVRDFEVQLSTDGIHYKTIALAFPDAAIPNRIYTIKVSVK